MAYALINLDGTLHSTTQYETFNWRNLTLTAVSRLSDAERKNLGIYSYAQKYTETPEGKKQCGFTQEINHAEGIVYEVPVFIDKSPLETAGEQVEKYTKEIVSLEIAVTPRRAREAILTEEGKLWLDAQDKKIAEVRVKLVEAIAASSVLVE